MVTTIEMLHKDEDTSNDTTAEYSKDTTEDIKDDKDGEDRIEGVSTLYYGLFLLIFIIIRMAERRKVIFETRL